MFTELIYSLPDGAIKGLGTKPVKPKATHAPALSNHQFIQDFIYAEYYFSGLDGVKGAGAGKTAAKNEDTENLKSLTFCCLVFANGYTVVGQAAVADMSTYDFEIGKKYAREDAIRKAMPLATFLIMQDRFDESTEAMLNFAKLFMPETPKSAHV